MRIDSFRPWHSLPHTVLPAAGPGASAEPVSAVRASAPARGGDTRPSYTFEAAPDGRMRAVFGPLHAGAPLGAATAPFAERVAAEIPAEDSTPASAPAQVEFDVKASGHTALYRLTSAIGGAARGRFVDTYA